MRQTINKTNEMIPLKKISMFSDTIKYLEIC